MSGRQSTGHTRTPHITSDAGYGIQKRMKQPANPTIEIIARGIWVRDSKVLLCRNIAGGYCYFPGGHVEFGESAAQALEREFAEECGEKVRAGRCLLVGEATFTQKGTYRHEVNIVFHVEPASGAPPANSCGTPPINSLEPALAFEWVAASALQSAAVRPKWLADQVPTLIRSLEPGTSASSPCPAWVSALES